LTTEVFKPIIGFFKSSADSPERKFKKAVEHIIGDKPSNLTLYHLAFRHTSVSKDSIVKGFKESNERLEFLGDSVLGMVIAEYLFKKFPFKDEGFLTEIRSRIVNRETLNQISRKIGLDRLIEYEGTRRGMPPNSSMYGDALEALVGAVYLDKGFRFSRKFITKQLLTHYDLDALIQNNVNFKSILIEWSQRENREVKFEIIEEKGTRHFKEFIAQISIEGKPFAKGSGYSKKKAEQSAAEKACTELGVK
jgi:ribonuclease III